MSKRHGHPQSLTIGIVGGKASMAERLANSMAALGYSIAFAVPDERALRERSPLKADAVIVIRPSRSDRSVGLAIDGKGIVRAGASLLEDRGPGTASPQLTNREKQAISLVVMGLTNRQIADKLYISESTVKSHLNTAYRKLGVQSRAEAVRVITDPATGFGTGIVAITGPAMTGSRQRDDDHRT